jgi:hypothetical protein
MEHALHGDVHPHPHRKASEHWSQIRHQKTNTVWIFLGIALAASAVVALVYFFILK